MVYRCWLWRHILPNKRGWKIIPFEGDLSRIFSLKPYDRTDSFIIENSEISGGHSFADYLKFLQKQSPMDEIECETTQDGNTIQGQITIGDETFTKILREAHQSAKVKIKVIVQTKKN